MTSPDETSSQEPATSVNVPPQSQQTSPTENQQVESSVDSFIAVSLGIIGVILAFVIPFGFVLAPVIFYAVYKYSRRSKQHGGNGKSGATAIVLTIMLIAVIYGVLINGLT